MCRPMCVLKLNDDGAVSWLLEEVRFKAALEGFVGMREPDRSL